MALFNASAVGQRVRVFWADDDEWFCGRVEAFDAAQGLFVRYDDGDERWESSDQLVQLDDAANDLVETKADGDQDSNNADENEEQEETEASEAAQRELPRSRTLDRAPQMMEPPASPSDMYEDGYSDDESKVPSNEATRGRRSSDTVANSNEDGDGVEQIDLGAAVVADSKDDDGNISDNNSDKSGSDDGDDNEQSIAMSEVPITFERVRAARSSTAQPQSTGAGSNRRAVGGAQLPLRGVLRGHVLRASNLPSVLAPDASHDRHALRPPRAFVKIAFAEASASSAAGAKSLMLRCKHALASTAVAPPSHDPVWTEHPASGSGDPSVDVHDHMGNDALHSGDGAFEMQLAPPPRHATAPSEQPAWLQLRGDVLFSVYSVAHSSADGSDDSAHGTHRRAIHDFIGQAVVSLRDILDHALFESLTLTRHLCLQTRQGKPLGRPRSSRNRALSDDDSDSDDARAVAAMAPPELVVAFAFEPTYTEDTRRRTRASSAQAKQRSSSARPLLRDQRSSTSLASQPKTSDHHHQQQQKKKTPSSSKAADKKTTHTSSSAINRRKFVKQVDQENAAFAKRIEWQHERRARRADLAKAQAKSKYPVPQHGSMKRDHKASSSVNRTKFQQQVTTENRAMEKRLHAIALKSEAKEVRSRFVRDAVGFDDPGKDKALARDRREERLREHDYLSARAQAKYQQHHQVASDVMALQSDIAALRAQVFAAKASVNRLEILNNKDEHLCKCLRSAAETSSSSSSGTKAPSAKRVTSSSARSASGDSAESSTSVARHRKELELLQTEAASLASETQRASQELQTCNQQEQALDDELARLDAQLRFVLAKQAFQARMRGKGSSSGSELRLAQEMKAKQQRLELSRDEEEQWTLYQAQQELVQLQIAVQVLQQQQEQHGASGLAATSSSIRSGNSATERAATAACAYLEKKVAKQQLKLEQLETEQRRLEREYEALVASGEYEALRKQVHELQHTLFLCQAQSKHVAAAERHASAADAALQIELRRQAFDQQTETDVLFKRKS